MDYVDSIRTSVGDIFLTFPLILVGFIFFLGTLTSNIGLLYLFAGHLFVAPSLSFLANEKGPAWFDGKDFSVFKSIQWIFSVFSVLTINIQALGGGNNNWMYLLVLLPFIGQFITRQVGSDKSVLWFFNVVGWFIHEKEVDAAPTCAMVPGADKLYTTPSAWLTHLTFFFGFVYANAAALLNEPVPTVNTTDSAEIESQTANIAKRVSNRKTIATTIVCSATFMFLVMLIFRYAKTPCEGGFFHSLIPLLIVGLTGASWFQIVYRSCGVRPTDVLGIVQGMISTVSADNPIVCVGA